MFTVSALNTAIDKKARSKPRYHPNSCWLMRTRSTSAQLLKYGVVQTDTLCADLRHWHQLYVAGRLQKPVLHVAAHAAVDGGIAANLDAAFCAALLLLPARFTTQQLLECVARLSYTADIRMSFAEDSNKVPFTVGIRRPWHPQIPSHGPLPSSTCSHKADAVHAQQTASLLAAGAQHSQGQQGRFRAAVRRPLQRSPRRLGRPAADGAAAVGAAQLHRVPSGTH